MNIFILNNRFNKPSNFIFLSAQLLEKLLYLSVLLFVLFFNLGSDKIIVSATATTPTTGGVDLPGTTSESNVTEVSVVMTPKYSEDGHNYYSLMTNFQGLDHGMYTGLQTTGNLGNNGPGVGNLFIFSSWDATSAYPAQGATATPFDGEGIGYSIRMPYDWSIDIPYLIKVYRTEKDSKTNTYKWAVSITNQNTQQTTVIGEIPAPVGVPEFIAPSDMFHERYIGEDPKCTDTSSAIEKIGVIFSDLKANGKPAILGTPTSSRRTGTTTPENLWLYQPCQPYIHNRVVGQSFYSAIGLNGAEFNSLIPSAGNNGNTDTGGGTNNDSGSSSSNSGSSSLTNGDIKSIVNGTEWYKQDIVCTATTNTNNTSSALSSKDLTEDQKIAQTFLVGFRASDVETGVMKAVAEKYKIGGIFILENNNNEKTFTKELFDGINSKVGIPLIVASDEEGGAVQRLRGLYEMPSALEMGAMTEAQVEEIGKTLGTKLLSATGVNTVLSPTLDIDYPNANSVAVHELARTFGSDPANITSKAGAFARGLSSTGIKPTYKHFPGLGSANGDSDFEISTSKPISELMLKDVLPFKDLVNQYNGMVMLDGAIVPGLTTGVDVASTSPEAVSLLRNDLKFNGIIMTDDLAATGVQYELPEAVTKALQAGVDMPIFVGEADAESKIQSAIDAVKAAKVDVQARVDKIISYKNGTSTPAANSIPTLNLTNGGAAASSGYSSTSGQSIPNIYLTAYSPPGPNGPGLQYRV